MKIEFYENINNGLNKARKRLPQKYVLGEPEVTANIYCKSRKLPNKATQNYSIDLRSLLGHPVGNIVLHLFTFFD